MLGFTYNPASQVHSRSASNPAYAWSVSDVVRVHNVNGLNQYTAAGPATFGYDPNGNLASTANAPHSTTYVYDVENRLVSATGSHNATLTYDPLGRLASVTSGGWTRRLAYDGDALVGEYEPGGYMFHRYIHGNDSKADDPLIWYDNWNGGWRQALLTDHQGSVIQVADMYGNPVGTNSYDPWGIPGANNAGRFGYTGQTWVPELGLWYYKARFYSPTLGRFLQVDPVGYKGGANLYGYVGNDPANFTDPSGLARVCVRTGETGRLAELTKCVDVDGNRNGKSRENDMSAKEMARVRSSYGGFIRRFGASPTGRVPDLASYHKPYGGDGTSAEKNTISIATQFWGFAASRIQDTRDAWSNIYLVKINSGPSPDALSPANLSPDGRVLTFTGKSLSAHPNTPFYSESFSDIGRVMIHETLHGYRRMDHGYLDHLARSFLDAFGMAGDGCAASDGFPSC